jgi:hypothetical protein
MALSFRLTLLVALGTRSAAQTDVWTGVAFHNSYGDSPSCHSPGGGLLRATITALAIDTDGCQCMVTDGSTYGERTKVCYTCGAAGSTVTTISGCNSDCSSCPWNLQGGTFINFAEVDTRLTLDSCYWMDGAYRKTTVNSTTYGAFPEGCPDLPANEPPCPSAPPPAPSTMWRGVAPYKTYPSDNGLCGPDPPYTTSSFDNTVTAVDVLDDGCHCIQGATGDGGPYIIKTCFTCSGSGTALSTITQCNADCSVCTGLPGVDSGTFRTFTDTYNLGVCMSPGDRAHAPSTLLDTKLTLLSTQAGAWVWPCPGPQMPCMNNTGLPSPMPPAPAPPPPAEIWHVGLTLVIAGDLADFTNGSIASLKYGIAALFDGIRGSDVTISLGPASVKVDATIETEGEESATLVKQSLDAMTQQSLGASLGVTIEQPFTTSAAPTSSGGPPSEGDDFPWLYVGIGAGLVALILLGLIARACCCKESNTASRLLDKGGKIHRIGGPTAPDPILVEQGASKAAGCLRGQAEKYAKAKRNALEKRDAPTSFSGI